MDIESEMSEILQENLGNVTEEKKTKIEKFGTVCKSYWETQRKSR